MNKLNFYLAVVVILLIGVSCKNTETLFQESKNNWITIGEASWVINNDEIAGKVKDDAGFITSKNQFRNFILELEFKPDSTINSGVFVRCENDPIGASNCYEINIWDSNPNHDYRTGGVVNTFATLSQIETIGKWNTYKIKCENNHLQAWVNGILTADFKDDKHIEGYVGLQAQGSGEIKFRNVKIRELQSKVAN